MATEQIEEVLTGDPKPKPGLADEHRSKLDSIVQQMVKNKESDSTIQVVVNDFKQKYSAIPQTTRQQPKSEPRQPEFKPMTNWLNMYQPQGYQPMVPENAVNEHTAKTSESSARIKNHLADIDNSVRNLLYEHKKNLSGRLTSQNLAVNPSEAAPVNFQAQQLADKDRKDVYVSPVEIESFKSEMPNNPVLLRRGLDQKVKDLTKSDPVQANILKGDIYRLDRQNNPEKESKISSNIDRINKGEYDYDVVTGRLVKPQGFFGSLATGYKEKVQAYDDYGVYKSGNEQEMLKLINKRLKDDPDEAVPVPKDGWIMHPLAEGARMVGGQPLKPLVGGAIAGYFSGGTAGAAAAAAISAPEMYKLTFGSALPHNYDAIKKQHPELSDTEALQQAVNLTHDQANVDALSGAAMGALGAKAGFAPTGLKAGLLQKSLGSALSQIGQTAAKKTLEGLGVGSVGAAGQVVKNLMAQNAGIPVDTGEGVKEQLIGGIGMTMGMTILAKFPEVIKPKTYNQLLQAFKGVPKEVIEASLSELEQGDRITAEQAQKAQRAIKEHADIDNSIKPNVPESDRLKVQQKIKERNELDASLETEDKAYHADTKEQIKALNDDINRISKGEERGDLQKLVDKEHKDGNLQGFVTETLRHASENDLKKYFKEISEQAHDPNSEATTIATFGEAIVNKAKELFPAEAPKESKISVIQPGEIKQPETITIKPKENAVPIGSPEEVHVGETFSSSEEMGAGVPESGEAAGTQEGRPVQEKGNVAGQEGAGEPPVGTASGGGIFVERPGTQLSFRGLQDTANEFGFEDVRSRDPKTDLQTKVNAERTAKEWASRGEYQRNIDEMLDKIDRRQMVPTDEQRLILEQYIENEKQKAREIPKYTQEYNRQLDKIRRLKEIGNVARSEAAAALRIPDGGSRAHPITDEPDAMIAKMKANAVDKLTDQQKAEVEAQVEKHKKANDEANAKIATLEEQVAKLDSQKEFNKVKSTTKRVKKTAEERMAFRRTEIEAAREALRKLRSGESGLSAVPLPGVRELMAIAPHVKNIMVDLVAQGVDNLQEVVKHLHTEFKDVLDGLTEKNIHDIIAGEYNEKSKPITELRRQINDIHDEAKYINKLEALLNGKEPKAESAKRERNQKIKELKDKIKGFKQDEKEANTFYGESDSGEKRLDKIRDELDRVKSRREKEKPLKDSHAEKEISAREQELMNDLREAQAQWDKEKESARNLKRDYAHLEAERNRQIEKISDLKKKLDDLQKGIKAKGKETNKKVDTPEIESLKEQVADAEKELNKTIATEKRIKGLEDELNRLKERKEKEPKEVNKREISDRENELKEQIDEERKVIRKEESEASKFYKEELDDDAKKLIAIRKRNQKTEQSIKEKIAKGQFERESKKSIFDREDIKKSYPRLRKDALDAIAKKEEAQHEFDLALFNDEMRQRKWYEKAAGFAGKLIHTSKAIMSGIDDSATFVQNGLAMLANPKIGAKAFIEHWKDAFSDARFKRELAALHQRPDWEVIKNSKLDIVEPHSAASKQVEEAFEKNLLAEIKIKGIKPWDYTGGIFERAFTSMGNNMRLLLFEKQMAALKEAGKTFESHPEEYKSAARAINELTGRAQLPAGIAQASPYITPFIWAPRMLASTINTLGLSDLVLGLNGKGYYQNLTPMQRRFALRQLGSGVGMGVAIMGAAALGGAKVDYDPRSVTFGDVIIGDHHYNVFGRYVPVIKTLVQATLGARIKGGGQEQDLDSGKFGAKTRLGVVGGFFRGKTTPFVGSMMNLAEGRNYFTNEKFGIKDLPESLLQPMSIKELRDGWHNDGTETLLNRFLPAFEGLKTSDERDFNKKSQQSSSSGSGGATRIKRTNPHQKH
jgi:hypothetical protein